MSRFWCNAVGVLKTPTRKTLEAHLNHRGRAVVDGWAGSNPRQVKAWEADGSLLTKAQAAQEQAEQALEAAQQAGQSNLPTHEIYQLYGGPELRLA